jgi:hypothetical protein
MGALRFRTLYRSLLINVLTPLLVAQWLLHHGWSTVLALAVAAIFPFVDGLVSIARRRIDAVGIMSFAALVLGIALSFLTGNPVFAIAKESFFTVAFGITFLGSLAARRPLIFYLGRQFNTTGDPLAQAQWDSRWEVPRFRHALRLITVVWGIGLVTESLVRVLVALTTPPATAVLLSPIIGIIAIGGLLVWTVAWSRRARRSAAATIAA